MGNRRWQANRVYVRWPQIGAGGLTPQSVLRLGVLSIGVAVLALLIARDALVGRAPHRVGAAPLPPVLINELLPHTDPPQVDSIELYNPTGDAVSLGGWCLSDDSDAACRYRIPAGVVIVANDYLVLTQTQFGFGLSEMGEDVLLSAANSAGALTGAQHRVRFAATANGVAVGRVVTSDGKEHFPPLRAVTLGQVNASPLVGPLVIAEIMYHPPADKDEYVELVNITSGKVALYDKAAPQNLWRLTGVGEFTFPAGLELPGRASLFVTPLAPADFRARHDLPADALVVGPYRGALSDNGEEIALWRPDTPNLDGAIPYLPVDRVDYDDAAPWPGAPDGAGPALQRKDAFTFGGEPANWQASSAVGGSGEALVELVDFAAAAAADGAHRQLLWSTRRERNVAGFTLWRSANDDRASAVQVGAGVVVGQGSRHLGGDYAVDDLSSNGETIYTYWLAVVDANQTSVDLADILAQPIQHIYLPLVASE